MSVSRAQELLKAVADDVVFRQQLENAPDPEAKRAVLEAHGFDGITKEDVEAAAAENGVELTDAELEAVAGGATTTWVGISVTVACALALA